MASAETKAASEGSEYKWIPADNRAKYDDAVAKSDKATQLDAVNRKTLQTW